MLVGTGAFGFAGAVAAIHITDDDTIILPVEMALPLQPEEKELPKPPPLPLVVIPFERPYEQCCELSVPIKNLFFGGFIPLEIKCLTGYKKEPATCTRPPPNGGRFYLLDFFV